MKVLVTGGSGFIGRHVVCALGGRGHEVTVLARSDTAPGAGVRVVRGDLGREGDLRPALAGTDAVVHCAAAMSGSFEEQFAVTVAGTRRLLAAMDAEGIRRLVLLSTFALYDYLAIPEGSALDETSPLADTTARRGPYEATKRDQEDLVRAWKGGAWTVLRPGIVFGRDRTWSYHLGAKVGRRRWLCYAGASLLPLTYVENCADAIALAVDSDAAAGAVLNVIDSDLPSRRGWMEALARREEPRPRISDVPWKLLDPTAGVATWIDRTLLLGRAPLPDLLRRSSLHARCKPLRYPNDRARDVLGWRPRIDLASALERSFAANAPR